MTILKNDIKVYQSQDNTDNDSGGGSRTSVEIVDGAVNNLFPDISRIDTVSGDVGLRKIFPTVVTANRDLYYGAHAIIRKTPTDPNVSALLFHTDDPHDKRIDAQNAIESYVIASYEEEFYLFGNHVAGAKTVTWLQLTSSTQPDVGEIYMIRDGDGITEQFVRVSSVDAQNITLIHTSGNTSTPYTRRRIICEIEQPLEVSFIGSSFQPSGRQSNASITFATQIANAANFYGTKVLNVNAIAGDQVITVDTIYEQVVPASLTQTPIVNVDAVVKGQSLEPTGETWSFTGGNFGIGGVTIFPSAIVPNSITQLINTGYIDDGKGNIINSSTSDVVGSVDYKQGVVTIGSVSIDSGGTTIYEIANLTDTTIEFTNGTLITTGNRNLVHVQNISPIPSITELYIDYRSNGKWYRIQSNGDDTLGFDASIGTGTISDNGDETATISLTLGSLPDVDSSIIYSWGSGKRLSVRNEVRTVDGNAVKMSEVTAWSLELDLADGDIDPLTFVMQVYDTTDNALVNITSDSEGNLIDAANVARTIEGSLDFIDGKVYITRTLSSNRFPDLGAIDQNVIIDYDTLTTVPADPHEIITNAGAVAPTGGQVTVVENAVTGTITFNIGSATTDRASFRCDVPITIGQSNYWGAGGVSVRYRTTLVRMKSDDSGILSAVNYRDSYGSYITGTLALNGDVSITLGQSTYAEINPAYAGTFGGEPKYLYIIDDYYSIESEVVSFAYRVDAPLGGVVRIPATTINDTMENLFNYRIQTTAGLAGEVYFNFLTETTTDQTYLLRSVGSNISHEYNSETGVGIQIGTINKNSGEITLNYFQKPNLMYLNFQSMITDEINTVEFEAGDFSAPVDNVVFRTSATRLSNGSFQLRYDTTAGTQIATSDNAGVVSGTSIQAGSTVDSVTGMADISFTVDVLASSLRYDAVAETSLPLDPELLGLNPVRLPIDGRVPVFKAGGHIVIFNEVTTPTTNATPLANDVETLARSGQAFIEVIDVEGKRLDSVQYIADKVAGTVTFTDPLVLEDKYSVALTAPFSIVDRLEDMLLATEVQINGLISLSAPLANSYTAGITYVASSLVWGDTGARIYNYFAQEIWNNGNPVWSDVLIGDPTTAQFDEINYPIQIDNQGSTSGRWAIIFTNATTVNVVEEKLGVVESGISISIDDVAPINPATGTPYFIMDRNGFGSGWVTNNVVRINTDSGDNNMWVIRTVASGALSESTDEIVLEIRGDAN